VGITQYRQSPFAVEATQQGVAAIHKPVEMEGACKHSKGNDQDTGGQHRGKLPVYLGEEGIPPVHKKV
jgi:hypothetical protein